MSEQERRRLFFNVMCKPEMRLLRAALRDMKQEHCIEWRDIKALAILPPLPIDGRPYGPWMLEADHWLSVCYDYDDRTPCFYVERLHDADDEFCECEWCQDSRLCYIRCKAAYV